MNDIALIDVSDLKSCHADRRDKVAAKIGQAAREIGFFRICGHGIKPKLVEKTYQVAQRFFALPDEVKHQYYIGLSSNHRGYVPFTEKGDYPDEIHRNYEAFDLALDLPADDPDYLAGNRILGPNVWPDLVGFKDTVSQYYNEISHLGKRICNSLEIYLGLPNGAITNQMRKPISQLRLLHYVRQNNKVNHKSVNMGAHTDYECLTLLHTRNQGLQVMTKDDRWIDVPIDPGVFVVNIGDMLEAWSNGILRSTPHRVINKSPERFSIPYFVAADYDTVIEPFAQLISPKRPARYEPFRAGDHLQRMLIRDFPYLRNTQLHKQNSDTHNNPFESRIN